MKLLLLTCTKCLIITNHSNQFHANKNNSKIVESFWMEKSVWSQKPVDYWQWPWTMVCISRLNVWNVKNKEEEKMVIQLKIISCLILSHLPICFFFYMNILQIVVDCKMKSFQSVESYATQINCWMHGFLFSFTIQFDVVSISVDVDSSNASLVMLILL